MLPTSLFQTAVLVYASVLTVIAFVLMFIPSLLSPGARPEMVGRAIACYLWKTFGLVVLSASVVSITHGVMTGNVPRFPDLTALILLFVIGLGIMVQASRILSAVDAASAAVPRLIFSHSVELIGGLIALMSALQIMLSFILTQQFNFWEKPATMLLLGLTMMLTASIHISEKNKGTRKRSKR